MGKIRVLTGLKKFAASSSAGGIVLLLCVVVSLAIANSPITDAFEQLLNSKIGISNSLLQLNYPVITWINDGLMAVFFLLVGLEIKKEILGGELSTARKASLPVLSAIGGVIAPALIYTVFNFGTSTANGWGIPMATDIAFALAILSLLGNRVPPALKIFLAALAIADDLMAILVIAVFYSADLHFEYLGYASICLALQLLFNRLGFKSLWYYLLPGIIMWYCIHHSGIYATIAGVLTALTLPAGNAGHSSPLEKLEHLLSNPVNFIIMPVFALANTNITYLPGMAADLAGKLELGIILGLLIGKPIGIFTMSWLSVKWRLSKLPAGVTWKHVLGLGLLGGIGFTMSIFIALLSLDTVHLQNEAKFAILIASLLSGISGFCLLKFTSVSKQF